MKAISVKASGMPLNSVICRAWSLIGENRLKIGVASAAVSYIGCLISADPIMYAGAIIALISVKPSEKKGGRK